MFAILTFSWKFETLIDPLNGIWTKCKFPSEYSNWWLLLKLSIHLLKLCSFINKKLTLTDFNKLKSQIINLLHWEWPKRLMYLAFGRESLVCMPYVNSNQVPTWSNESSWKSARVWAEIESLLDKCSAHISLLTRQKCRYVVPNPKRTILAAGRQSILIT